MNWPSVPLSEVAETALGKMLDKGKPRGHPHVPYLRNVNVQWGRIETHDLLTMELADDERERFAVKEGDLLVCEGGEIGRCAIWSGQTGYLAYQKALHRIRPGDDLDARFLRYLLEHHSLNGTLTRLATGSTIAHLPQQQLRRLPVPLPPLDEQRRIVDLLEDHLSRLDAAERTLQTVSKRTISMLESWLRLHLAADSAIESGSLGSFLRDVRGGWSRSRSHLVPAARGHTYLKMNNITRRGRLDLHELVHVEAGVDEAYKYGIVAGDILFNSKNSGDLIGKTAFADSRVEGALINENIMRLRFDDRVDPAYAAIWFLGPEARSAIVRSASASTNVAAVYQKDLVQFPFQLPSREQQAILVRSFEDLRTASERLSAGTERLSKRSASLRRSLLATAFSGRLTRSASDLSVAEQMINQ